MKDNSLLKILTAHNVGSRRYCFDLIKTGLVEVNNKVITDPAFEIDKQKDKIKVEGERLKLTEVKKIYIMLNKPQGYLSSTKSQDNKKTLFDLIKHKKLKKIKLFNVGRLDFKTEGLIFLTNDGDFAKYIIMPRYKVLKHYIVEVKGKFPDELLTKVKKGIYSREGKYKVEDIKILDRKNKYTRLEIILNEGKNREIRNIFAILKYKITLIRRVKIGPFSLPKSLKPGQYKLISSRQIDKFIKSFQ